MAELATGAVTTLLGVIRNESERLGRARADMLFIQEEMESMHSFLAHLQARSREQEQDAQVRTWMNQVRILATDCNKFLDVYLYKRNQELNCPRTGTCRYFLWRGSAWAFWWLYDMLVQHCAAEELRQLKERARDIGERRLRYGVKLKVPAAAAAAAGQSPSLSQGAGAGFTAEPSSLMLAAAPQDDNDDDDDGEEGGGNNKADALMSAKNTEATSKLEDYFKKRIAVWMQERHDASVVEVAGKPQEEHSPQAAAAVPTVALMLPADTPTHHVVQGLQAEANKVFSPWRSVLVDVPAVHNEDVMPLRPKEILYYILWELQSPPENQPPRRRTKWAIHCAKKELLRDIKRHINEMKLEEKLMPQGVEINYDDQPPPVLLATAGQDDLEEGITTKMSLDELVRLLIWSTTADQDRPKQAKSLRTFSALYDTIIQTTAKELERSTQVLSSLEYANILQQVFPRTDKGASSTSTGEASVEEEIKEVVGMVKELLQELQEYNKKSAEDQDGEAGELHQETEAGVKNMKMKEAVEKMKKFHRLVREQLKIKQIVHKIQCLLKKDEKILIILKMDAKHVSKWEETSNSLGLSGPVAGAVIVTTGTTTTLKSYPQLDTLEYSFAGMCVDIVRQHTSQDNLQIVRNILKECGQHEFCKDIFAQALKANPKRSSKELRKLHSTLQATPKSRPSSIASKMFKFSYSDLPQGHKTCLLYLAIFLPDHKIRRSTLVGRWVVEGLVTTEDWQWSSSVDEANKCFNCLIERKFVHPDDIGATGRAKTCKVDPMVHKFITKIAMKQRILEARLPPGLACHFSIFNDVRLRRTNAISDFLVKIHDSTQFFNLFALRSSQFSKLKVLDLEGCRCFDKHQCYLKDICRNIPMLKYLSLRGTDVTWLPNKINEIHELEVLDIRETEIPASETKKVLLLKLKRLLAGRTTDQSPSNSGSTGMAKDFSSVQIPELIEKMKDVEVLSNVQPRKSRDLDDIGHLSLLRKLGVSINKDEYLQPFLVLITNLSELRSLSVTLNISIPVGTDPPKLPDSLESLSISGCTQKVQLLRLLVTKNHSTKLVKVTLRGTLLKQDDLKVLANLDNLRCVRLRQGAYTDSQLTFEKDEFPKLELLIVDSSSINNISFNGGSPKVEKIVWSFTKMESLSGVDKLLVLKELELSGTSLKQEVLNVLAKLPQLQCVRLRHAAHIELTLNKGEFPMLSLLIIDSSQSTKISFNGGAPELKKIVLSFIDSYKITNFSSTDGSPESEIVLSFANITDTNESPEPKKTVLFGIDKLQGLKEFELVGDISFDVGEALKKYSNGKNFIYRHIKKPVNQVTRNPSQGNHVERRRSFWEVKGRCWRN